MAGLSLQFVLILLLVAAAVAVVVKSIRLPYAVALVIVGAAIGASGLLPQFRLSQAVHGKLTRGIDHRLRELR